MLHSVPSNVHILKILILFEQQCAILKGLLQSDLLKQHTVTIGINQSLSNCTMYEHISMENIKKLYTSAGKCNDQLKFKAIIDA